MPRSLSPTTVVRAGRRGVLGAALVAPLAACTGGGDDEPSGGGPSSGVTTKGATSAGEQPPDPDTDLVAGVVTALARAQASVRAVRRDHPALDDVLEPLERLHRLHGRELGGPGRARGRRAPAGEGRQAALGRVRSLEDGLRTTLVRAAVQARSGALAQTLAAMAASVAQARTTL